MPLIFFDSLKKKEEIEVLNCRVADALNSSLPQSRFSEATVGCVDGSDYCQNIHAPTSSINHAIPFIPSGIGNLPVIIAISGPKPMIKNLFDHISSVGTMGSTGSAETLFVDRKLTVVSIDIDVNKDINTNASRPPNTTFAIMFMVYSYFLLRRMMVPFVHSCQEIDLRGRSSHTSLNSLLNNSPFDSFLLSTQFLICNEVQTSKNRPSFPTSPYQSTNEGDFLVLILIFYKFRISFSI